MEFDFMAEIRGGSKIGKGTYIGENVIIGYPGKDEAQLLKEGKFDLLEGAIIGENCILRDYGIIYSRSKLGDNIKTGHHYLVRENTVIGSSTLIGSGVVIEDECRIGSNVSIQSNVYIPTNCVIEDNVFLGPNGVLTNDKRMGRGDWKLEGVTIKFGARIGANVTILPGITIGRDAVIGGGAVVTKDVPDLEIMVGVPARSIGKVPEEDRI
jgi:acetyltransferase-like isoleucine patch superfamily enzyme